MRSLPGEARHERRIQVIALRAAGRSYVEISLATGLSRTGVFDICKRHAAGGERALRDAPNGHKVGDGRLLEPTQEALLCELIAQHTPDEVALPGWLWTCAGVTQLIAQRCGAQLSPRTTRLYLARWGYGPQQRLRMADEPAPGAFGHWLAEDYPAIVLRARAEAAEIRWGDEGQPWQATPSDSADRSSTDHAGPALYSTLTNRGQRHWMGVAPSPDAHALIGFLQRLTRGHDGKLFLIHGNLRVHEDGGLALWLAEHDELIEVFCLPGHDTQGLRVSALRHAA